MIQEFKSTAADSTAAPEARGWRTRRFATCARLVSRKNRTDLQLLSVFLNRGVIPYGQGGGQVHKPGADLNAYQVVQPGNLVLNNQQAWRGSVGVSAFEGIISPAYLVFELCSDLGPSFGNYLFQSRPMVDQYVIASKGVGDIQRDIYLPWLKNICIPIPPPEEQAAIVRFLDYADRRIRQYVLAKQKLIKLLEEQKQAIIHLAVTRGLDPNVRLKPSGVDWIGSVPEHWDVKKLRAIFDPMGGMTPSKANSQYWGGTIPWVSPKDMKVDVLADSIDHITQLAIDETNIQVIDPPAVLMVVRGMILARTVPVAVTTAAVTINQDMKALVPRDTIHAQFARLAIVGAERHVKALVEESGHGTRVLRTQLWRDILLPLPPCDEQKKIMNRVQEELAKQNCVIQQCEEVVTAIRGFRATLIADVVTGRLDVREAASRLPHEIKAVDEEPIEAEELLDEAEVGEELEEVGIG